MPEISPKKTQKNLKIRRCGGPQPSRVGEVSKVFYDSDFGLIQAKGVGGIFGIFGIPGRKFFENTPPPPWRFWENPPFVPEIEEKRENSLNLTRFSLN